MDTRPQRKFILLSQFLLFMYLFAVPTMESKASHVPGKHSTSKVSLWPIFFVVVVVGFLSIFLCTYFFTHEPRPRFIYKEKKYIVYCFLDLTGNVSFFSFPCINIHFAMSLNSVLISQLSSEKGLI